MKNKLVAQIDKAYTKRTKDLNKNFTTDSTTGLAIFIEQLKYIRDILILHHNTNRLESPFEGIDPVESPFDAKLTSLIIAISEFEASQQAEDADKKIFHWNNFWEFVKLNAGEWLMSDDTI